MPGTGKFLDIHLFADGRFTFIVKAGRFMLRSDVRRISPRPPAPRLQR